MIGNTINSSFDAKVRKPKNPKLGQKGVPKFFFQVAQLENTFNPEY